VEVLQDPTADAKDHRPVTLDHGRKGGGVAAPGEEFLQELAVGQPPDRHDTENVPISRNAAFDDPESMVRFLWRPRPSTVVRPTTPERYLDDWPG
jgi:hypothetical protein